MSGLTLRQVEVIRAVMLTGSIGGAARFLNISGPGVSRLVKHAEDSLRIRLFERKGGVFLPAPEARAVFDQINEVYGKIEGLETAIANLNSGDSGALAFGSVPSVAQFILARAVVSVRRRFPDLFIDLNVLKIEETVDYLLLERGELVAMSYAYDHPSLENTELGVGELIAVVPDGHPLAARARISVRELEAEPVVGVSPDDPYGAIIDGVFRAAGVEYRLSIKARFAQTVVSLVRHGLGVALIDEFGRMVADAGLAIVAFQPFRDFEGMPEPQRARGFERARRKFALMNELGASRILVCSNVSPLALGGIDRAAEDLRELGGIADGFGIDVGFEALAWGRHVWDYRDAWEIVRRADHPRIGLILDSWNLLARGLPTDPIRAIPADRMTFVQLADAPKMDMDLLQWSRHFRNFPGQGDMPVDAFMAAVQTPPASIRIRRTAALPRPRPASAAGAG